MSGEPDLASLTSWLQRLDKDVRNLVTGNPLNKGSVQNAEGQWVALSSLAFGQVINTKAGVGAVSMTGTIGSAGASPFWITPGPNVEVLVQGGKLRVDWASLLAVSGWDTTMVMSYGVYYMGPPEAKGPVQYAVVDPDYYRALIFKADGGVTASGSFALHSGLQPGWYRVAAAYYMAWSDRNTTEAPAASADNPRIGATPF